MTSLVDQIHNHINTSLELDCQDKDLDSYETAYILIKYVSFIRKCAIDMAEFYEINKPSLNDYDDFDDQLGMEASNFCRLDDESMELINDNLGERIFIEIPDNYALISETVKKYIIYRITKFVFANILRKIVLTRSELDLPNLTKSQIKTIHKNNIDIIKKITLDMFDDTEDQGISRWIYPSNPRYVIERIMKKYKNISMNTIISASTLFESSKLMVENSNPQKDLQKILRKHGILH